MQQTNNTIYIAYSCDEAYIHHTGISLISLFENNKGINSIIIYFIEKGVRQESINQLQTICDKYKRKLEVIPFSSICNDLHPSDTGRHIETIYSKLFFSRISNIDKMLYIDSDTIINGSIHELWSIDLSNYCVAGVETYTVKSKERLNLLPEDNFINDGIVLLNLEKLRKNRYDLKFLDFINMFNGNPPLLSEGTINFVCKGSILSLHPKFNLMSGLISIPNTNYTKNKYLSNYYSDEIIDEAIKSPVIIHYLSAFYNRPWDKNCTHPLKNRYLFYKSLSPWRNIPLTNKKLTLRLRFIKYLQNMLPERFFLSLRYISILLKNKFNVRN
ncbi:Lipopolysaccharide biosynthesis protein, LPS:glycosyltransferase [Draconibacterium orientale]|jgi:lipopolysaccharide biosynthesis glycosyltransferase|uniref:Glycosyl transferase family 8 n=1 Tax=Draconibacterium orientale TaxID=1168034 RepID=X5DLA8_9BACT|nr:glycosyltransferase [Draconibacterium orientale]AHW61317.1 glycosyl transferase family 8 [Draconibacterium orientale]SEU05594.1 Lipopolysaccharide biosynthesis protein, LPS:glycosyltransferase [Draconibacterium orientale]